MTMMKNQFAASITLALLMGTSIAVHAEDCCMPEYMPGEVLCDGCVGYSQYAGVELDCGWDVFAWGEFLYWRPYTARAYVVDQIPANTFTQPQIQIGHKYGFRPGFSVGLGMVAHCFDDWIFNVDYTRYHQNFSKTFTAPPTTTLRSILILSGVVCTSIKDKTDFHYDIVGFNVQRPNYLGQRVILSPFLGLKWLKRDIFYRQDLLDTNGGLSTATNALKYTSIGIDAGFDGGWLLCWGLRLIGKADVALLYPYERSLHQVTRPAVVTTGSPVVNAKHHIRHLDIYARGGLGFGWGRYFCCNRYHFDIAATYDWMADIIKQDLYNGMVYDGSTVLMGLAIRAQFDF